MAVKNSDSTWISRNSGSMSTAEFGCRRVCKRERERDAGTSVRSTRECGWCWAERERGICVTANQRTSEYEAACAIAIARVCVPSPAPPSLRCAVAPAAPSLGCS